jgi:hypothetical protein
VTARAWAVLGLWLSLLGASACLGVLVGHWAAGGLAGSLCTALLLLVGVELPDRAARRADRRAR